MTNEQRLESIRELARGLSANELREIGSDLDDMGEEEAARECAINGHQIGNDHCGRPEHRFCSHCYQRETDINARQAEVDEATASKAVQPSESLGSGSILARVRSFVGILVVIVGIALCANAQCVSTPTDTCVTVHQSILDRAAKAVDELTAARDLIAKQALALNATDTERAAYKSFAAAADSAIAVLQKGIVDREQLIALQQKALELYSTLVEKLTAQLNKPKSAWAKFAQTLKEIALVAAGVMIGGL